MTRVVDLAGMHGGGERGTIRGCCEGREDEAEVAEKATSPAPAAAALAVTAPATAAVLAAALAEEARVPALGTRAPAKVFSLRPALCGGTCCRPIIRAAVLLFAASLG